jgi:REP element-mobilizing transposase RayT/CheY-like chemotaxis protein
MKVPLLVVTPHPSFGELIRQSLEETGSYLVQVVGNSDAAASLVKEEGCALVFLDMDLQDSSVSEIGRTLRSIDPKIGLVIISDDEPPAVFDEIRPWTLLRKPFYLPDLLDMLDDSTAQSIEPSGEGETLMEMNSSVEKPVSWLEDVTKAAQHLTRLTLESAAQAALITRDNELWAYAGQLSQDAAKELAEIVARDQKENDLLRFARLESTRAEHMLYATRLFPGVTLALVFDAETPFGTIRSQANHLANSLSIDPSKSKSVSAQMQSEVEFSGPEMSHDADSDDELEIPSIAGILNNVPPSDPAKTLQMQVAGTLDEELAYPWDLKDENDEDYSRTLTDETRSSASIPGSANFSRETSPALQRQDLTWDNQPSNVDTEEAEQDVLEDLDATVPTKARSRTKPSTRQPDLDELDQTRPLSNKEVTGRIVLEPVSPGVYNLTYACLLIPRFSTHYLTGDLADSLSEWLPQICVAFGWRLEYLAVRPEYLQWVVNVPPATSPGYLMRIMRQQTSEKIFAEFQRIKRENPSGDFWAPGYLIMGGTQQHPPQLVKDYIQQTRQRQGISRPRK